MSFLKNTVAAAVLAASLAAPAFAAPISPNQSFDTNGSLRVSNLPFDQATGLDFGTGTTAPITYGTAGGTATLAGGATGSNFVGKGFNVGSMGTITDIAPGNLSTGVKNLMNFFSFTSGGNTLQFDLMSISQVLRVAASPANNNTASIIVSGAGTVRLTGFDATTASFSLTTTNAGVDDVAAFATSVNTGSNPSVVPEPASMALLGMGLAGLTLVRRRKT